MWSNNKNWLGLRRNRISNLLILHAWLKGLGNINRSLYMKEFNRNCRKNNKINKNWRKNWIYRFKKIIHSRLGLMRNIKPKKEDQVHKNLIVLNQNKKKVISVKVHFNLDKLFYLSLMKKEQKLWTLIEILTRNHHNLYNKINTLNWKKSLTN